MTGLGCCIEVKMGGAQEVPLQKMGACLDMLKTVLCCVEDELTFFNLPIVSERTNCGCWTDLGPAVIVLSLALPPSGSASLVLSTSRLSCLRRSLSLTSLLGYHGWNGLPKPQLTAMGSFHITEMLMKIFYFGLDRTHFSLSMKLWLLKKKRKQNYVFYR